MFYNQAVQIRLSEQQYQHYLVAASQAGLPLSRYLRDQLDQPTLWQAELLLQRQLLEDLTALLATLPAAPTASTTLDPQAQSPTLTTTQWHSLSIELLLLSRLQAGPDKVLRVARDLERWGLPVWTSPIS